MTAFWFCPAAGPALRRAAMSVVELKLVEVLAR